MAADGRIRTTARQLRRAIEGPDGPPLAWTLRGYRPEQVRGDVVAGLTVAALIIPLAMGYAAVAGLPPETGLYASMVPLLAYALLGSGRRLVVGPDASSAALIGAAIAPIAAASDDRVRLAGVLALMVASMFIVMRIGRMGFLADFLSRPILVGYLTGVGITVVVGQLEKMAGGPVLTDAIGVLGGIDWASVNPAAVVDALRISTEQSGAEALSAAIGIAVVVAMLIGRRVVPRVPMAIVAMTVALIASYAFDLQSRGVQVLGPVPAGLPRPGIPLASAAELLGLLPGAIGLAILTFADTAATGRSFARRHGERTDANRELVALAMADAGGALTGGYPVSSSPSRTAASENAGSSTQMAGIVAFAGVAVVLVLLTGPLAYLPIPALGAVILVSVFGIIDVRGIISIWRLKAGEGLIAAITMTGVILYGTLIGVMLAVLLAALNIVRRAAWPHIVEEGRLASGTWRDLGRRSDGRRVADVIVLRFSGPMFFANASALEARVRELVGERPATKAIVLDLGPVADIDVTAGDTLRQIADDLSREGRHLAVARPMGPVRDELRTYGLASLMAATGGTHGSVDDVIRGLGLDPAVMDEVDAWPAAPIDGEDEETGAGRTDETAAADAMAAAAGGAPAASSVEPLPVPTGDGGSGASGDTVDRPFRLAGRMIGAVAGVVVVAMLVGAGLGAWAARSPGSVPIPNLVGLSLERAVTAAADAGFVLDQPRYVRRPDQPDGTVVAQTPGAGSQAAPGATIRPVVSTVRPLVVVPDILGQSEAQAIATLTSAGLAVRRAGSVPSATVPAGAVVETSPAAGSTVASGATVEYTLSTGAAARRSPAEAAAVSPRGATAAGVVARPSEPAAGRAAS